MKKKIMMIAILFVAACKPTYEYVDKNWQKQVKVIKEISYIDSETKTTEFNKNITCDTGRTQPGLCCKCGWTLQMKHECSCSTWRNCPIEGNTIVSYVNTSVYARKKFILEDNQIVVFENKELISSNNTEISRTVCK